MDQFPFTEEEWAAVSDAALPTLNATLMDDSVLRTSHFIELQNVLFELGLKYGEHPVLLETDADWTDDDQEKIDLYQRAVTIAEMHCLSTFSIRISLAGVFIETGCRTMALHELMACEREFAEADDWEQSEWQKLKLLAEPPDK